MNVCFVGAASSLLFCSFLQASLASIHDDSKVNKFLGSAVPSCSAGSAGCNAGDITTSSMYVDQRQTIDGYLGFNFAQHKDRVYYIFNEFGYWDAQRIQFMTSLNSDAAYSSSNATTNDLGLAEVNQLANLNQQVQAKYPGAGAYIIAISALPAFVARVGQNVVCAKDQVKVAAVLFYDNGGGFQPLSAYCIPLLPTDKFDLYILPSASNQVDLPAGTTAFSGVLTASATGAVNFQAKSIVTSYPPAGALAANSNSGPSSTSAPAQASSSATDSSDPAAAITPIITFGEAINMGASPQSLILKKIS